MNSTTETVLQLKLEVPNLQRPVWRRFQVLSTQTFFDLHCAIQNLMGFGFETAFAFHVHDTEGNLKTFAIEDEVGYFTPEPQVAWLCRIADYISQNGNRRMEYLHSAVFAPWVFSITLESVWPREAGVPYPRCIAGERAAFESDGGTLGFMEAVETGTDLPDGFDPEFFNPAAVHFDDSKQEQMWAAFLEPYLVPFLARDVLRRAETGVDTGDRHVVLMPAPFYDLLLKLNIAVPAAERDYNPADALDFLRLSFSKAALRRLAAAIKARKSRHLDRVTARRLAVVSKFINCIHEGLDPSRPVDRVPRTEARHPSKWVRAARSIPGLVEPDPMCPITLAAGIWRLGEKFQPVIICRRKGSDDHRFVAVKMPVVEREHPVNAAQIAQLDLLQAEAELEPPQTDMTARLFAIKMGYGIVPVMEVKDVAPADVVLQYEDERIREIRLTVEKSTREADPPIFRETLDRLIRGGRSAEDATDMICRSIVIEFMRRPGEESDAESIEHALTRLPNFRDDL